MKTCHDCKQPKPPEDFGKDSSQTDGKRGYCRDCCAIRSRRSYTANPEIHKARVRSWVSRNPERHARNGQNAKLKKTFGITLAQKETMLSDQDGKCKICGDVMQKPCVDHCHVTGKIRGLLCRDCNFAIGLFNDSIPILQAAAAYLTPAESDIPATTG